MCVLHSSLVRAWRTQTAPWAQDTCLRCLKYGHRNLDWRPDQRTSSLQPFNLSSPLCLLKLQCTLSVSLKAPRLSLSRAGLSLSLSLQSRPVSLSLSLSRAGLSLSLSRTGLSLSLSLSLSSEQACLYISLSLSLSLQNRPVSLTLSLSSEQACLYISLSLSRAGLFEATGAPAEHPAQQQIPVLDDLLLLPSCPLTSCSLCSNTLFFS